MTRKTIIPIISFLFIFITTLSGFAAEVHLAWDSSSGTVTGYRIYYGTTQGDHPLMVVAGNVTDYILTGLDENTTYYIVTRAYNEYGESGNSNEISWMADSEPPITEPPITEPPEGALVSNLSPSQFEIGNVHVGETVYIDRDYEILSGYSSEYEGLKLIKTACDDKHNSSSNYLSFDISESCTVYVCFEQTTPPNWLSSGFVKTNDIIPRTYRTYDIWSKGFPKGKIILGGSEADGAAEINATYFVMIKESSGALGAPPAPVGLDITIGP